MSLLRGGLSDGLGRRGRYDAVIEALEPVTRPEDQNPVIEQKKIFKESEYYDMYVDRVLYQD